MASPLARTRTICVGMNSKGVCAYKLHANAHAIPTMQQGISGLLTHTSLREQHIVAQVACKGACNARSGEGMTDVEVVVFLRCSTWSVRVLQDVVLHVKVLVVLVVDVKCPCAARRCIGGAERKVLLFSKWMCSTLMQSCLLRVLLIVLDNVVQDVSVLDGVVYSILRDNEVVVFVVDVVEVNVAPHSAGAASSGCVDVMHVLRDVLVVVLEVDVLDVGGVALCWCC
eukprot:6491174-Amphidinium_carterae.1